MSAEWSAEAEANLGDIVRYIAADNASAARKVARRLRDAADLLGQSSGLGVSIEGDLRKWSVRPYVILYEPTRDGVRILRIRHARQNWRP